MIKICSLDFLNRETFETDVMTADGKVLCVSGDKITPEAILRLYFKEIYVAQPLEERIAGVLKEIQEFENEEVINKAPNNPEPIEFIESLESEPHIIMVEEKEEKEEKEEEEQQQNPHLIEVKAIEKSSESKVPHLVESVNIEQKEAVDNSKGPRTVIELSEKEAEQRKIYANLNTSKKSLDEKSPKESSVSEPSEVISEIPKGPDYLKFNDEQATRIAKYSVKLGELLNYSKDELEELKKAAYHCNIGISKFTIEDLEKKGFEKRKALESYEMLLEKGFSEKIAEAVKLCINNYDSDTFTLSSKIPYYHIIAITYYYENLLSQTNSKQKALEKMLELGGNKFNIFILHKFIKIMRETND